jgi:hypothetical protein
MIKLTKTQEATWNGNGFGTTTADWVVVGYENIAVRQLGISWFAVDTSEFAIINGRKVNKKIAKAETKRDLVKILTSKLS